MDLNNRRIAVWEDVSPEGWTYDFKNTDIHLIAYKLTRLPDFTEPRFDYLCKENDQRQSEVVKRQMSMLRELHDLGESCSISLRLLKENNEITLYIVVRVALNSYINIDNIERQVTNSLMKEYSFERVNSLDEIIDLSWANEVSEIIKDEKEYSGPVYPDGSKMTFYVPTSWKPADNSMERICKALINHQGKACVDITIAPTQYFEKERDWIGKSVEYLKEYMNGSTIRNERHQVIWTGEKMPQLKGPIDNLEKMNKQYDEQNGLFLSSIRVFSDKDVRPLSSALIHNSVKNQGSNLSFRRGFGMFNYYVACFQNVDVSLQAHSIYWNTHRTGEEPFRAQRLSRLNSVEEISNFFRIPVPIRKEFPGFGLDTGLGAVKRGRITRSQIRLGNYLDVEGSTPASVLDSQQFAKHGLIVGVPGSGKTTAMFNILYQLWDAAEEKKIPFIVLEPAKTEYRALKSLDVFKDDLLVFTLGDEDVSPFRFNPMEVLPGVKLENHISKLQACFVGAFDLFDPLPIFLEQAIRRTYLEKGWYEDSKGGDIGLETPTLSDLCRNAEYIVSHSGFDAKMKSDFQASLLERLNSLRRGSKGRMLDTMHTIPMEELMKKPIVLELDSLNGDEKSLIMMFLLVYVFEYCKVMRRSGSPLQHMLVVEEAHNLIGASGGGSEYRADPKSHTIELFVNMLAEMRALGQGILIADQLPTAIAPQAVKQTNVKILMRETAKDDREEIGNTMDLDEEQMHRVVNFKTGHAYVYHEGEDHVRMLRMINFKGEHDVEEPPTDEELKEIMSNYEETHKDLYIPYEQCSKVCSRCQRRVRNQAESFVDKLFNTPGKDIYNHAFPKEKSDIDRFRKVLPPVTAALAATNHEVKRIKNRYGELGSAFGGCVYVHILQRREAKKLKLTDQENIYMEKFKKLSREKNNE